MNKKRDETFNNEKERVKQYGKRKTIKKGIAIALSMMLAVTVLPTGFGVPKVQAAGEMLYVGNIRVTEANASDVLGNKTISYQASTHTLTLNGANLTTPMKAGKYIYGIRYEGAGQTLNLVLNGTNTITTVNAQSSFPYFFMSVPFYFTVTLQVAFLPEA